MFSRHFQMNLLYCTTTLPHSQIKMVILSVCKRTHPRAFLRLLPSWHNFYKEIKNNFIMPFTSELGAVNLWVHSQYFGKELRFRL